MNSHHHRRHLFLILLLPLVFIYALGKILGLTLKLIWLWLRLAVNTSRLAWSGGKLLALRLRAASR